MESPRIADMTVNEFRELVRDIVIQSVTELLGDPDEGLTLREDFAERLELSLADVEAGEATTSLEDVAGRLGSPG
jgi:hypothetical protein